MDKKEVKAAVDVFKGKIDDALKGNNVVQDIQEAVWDLLKDLGVELQNK